MKGPTSPGNARTCLALISCSTPRQDNIECKHSWTIVHGIQLSTDSTKDFWCLTAGLSFTLTSICWSPQRRDYSLCKSLAERKNCLDKMWSKITNLSHSSPDGYLILTSIRPSKTFLGISDSPISNSLFLPTLPRIESDTRCSYTHW